MAEDEANQEENQEEEVEGVGEPPLNRHGGWQKFRCAGQRQTTKWEVFCFGVTHCCHTSDFYFAVVCLTLDNHTGREQLHGRHIFLSKNDF